MKIVVNDCIEAMRAMEENSIDAIVTDPPYGLEFMGKSFDSLTEKWAVFETIPEEWVRDFGEGME